MSDSMVRVILSGGPDGTPPVWEMPPGGPGEQVKIARGNGYEHFEFVHEYGEFEGEVLPVYRWCYRTSIAE